MDPDAGDRFPTCVLNISLISVCSRHTTSVSCPSAKGDHVLHESVLVVREDWHVGVTPDDNLCRVGQRASDTASWQALERGANKAGFAQMQRP